MSACAHRLIPLLLSGWVCVSPSIAGAEDPAQIAQARNLSARADVEPAVSPAAAPRPGEGESALISVGPGAAPRAGNGESALIGGPTESNGAPVPPARSNAQSAPADPAAKQEKPQGTGLKAWGIPPIRWGGYLALDLQSVALEGQPRRTALMESARFAANSYIWQPWFAQVSGELTLLAAQQRGNDVAAVSSGSADSGLYAGGMASHSVTGGGQLALFPASRFPFTASYNQSDSRASGELTNNAYTSRSTTLSQAYAPLGGASSYRVSYQRSDLSSESFGNDSARSLSGSMNWSNAANTLAVSGNRYSNVRTRSGDRSAVDTIYATHSYRPSTTFSVESLANFSDNQYRFVSAAQPLDLTSRFLQFNSIATWRPAEASPLLVTGGARVFQASAGSNGVTAESTTVSANAAALYTLNRNTTLSGSGTLSRVTNRGSSSLYSHLGAGITYASDIIPWGPYGYGWNAGGNAAIQHAPDNSGTNVGAYIGHRLTRSFPLGDGSTLSMNASQSYSWINDSMLANSQSLMHGAGASWARQAGENASLLLSFEASDLRTWGYSAQHFQLLNMQANGQMRFSRWSSANANLTLQVARQGTSTDLATSSGVPSIGRTTVSTAGNVNYQHTRAFGVPRLSYHALLTLNQRQQRTRLEGDINAPIEHVDWSFEQRLDYFIGRLELRLSMRMAAIEGRTNSLIFLRALRRFGN